MKQPIYIIHKKDFDAIFAHARENAVIPHPHELYSFSWGTLKSKEEFLAMVESIKFDENETVLVSKVMEVLNKHRTSKMIGYANRFLDYYKNQINSRRKPKE